MLAEGTPSSRSCTTEAPVKRISRASASLTRTPSAADSGSQNISGSATPETLARRRVRRYVAANADRTGIGFRTTEVFTALLSGSSYPRRAPPGARLALRRADGAIARSAARSSADPSALRPPAWHYAALTFTSTSCAV